jgi:hypothetical protein
MKTHGYPIIVKASARLVEELMGCEEGRYEDKGVAVERGESDYPDQVGYEILECRRRDIEIRNEAELRELRWATGSGTIGLQSWGMYRAALCLIRRLDEAAEALGVEFDELERCYPDSPEFGIGQAWA